MHRPTTRVRLGRSVLIGVVIGGIAPLCAVPAPMAEASSDTPGGSPSMTTPVQRAWGWVLGQQASATTASSIAADRNYATDWTGPVSGTFTPTGVSSPVVNSAALTVDTPTSMPGTFRGFLHGHLQVAPAAGRWIVQIYRDTTTGRSQVPLQAQADPNGDYTVDLGNAPAQPAGSGPSAYSVGEYSSQDRK